MSNISRQSVGIFIVCMMAFLCGCASQQPKNADVGALKAAETWFNALDSLDGESLWQQTSHLTREKQEKDVQLKYWVGGRKGYGQVVKRDLQLNFEVLPYQFKGNIPDGVYRHIVYWTKYENRELTKEDLFLSFESGEWKILQYVVK